MKSPMICGINSIVQILAGKRRGIITTLKKRNGMTSMDWMLAVWIDSQGDKFIPFWRWNNGNVFTSFYITKDSKTIVNVDGKYLRRTCDIEVYL